MEGIRVNRSTARLLKYFLKQHLAGRPVADVSAMTATHIGGRVFYSTVERLRKEEWITQTDEELPLDADRLPRTFYQLTKKGAQLASEAVLTDDKGAALLRKVGRQRRIGE